MTMNKQQANEIVKVLKANQSNISKTARDLKISRARVYFAIQEYAEHKQMESWIECEKKFGKCYVSKELV